MQVGDRIERDEDRAERGGTVLEIDGENVLISYDEGGKGWWPVAMLILMADPAQLQPGGTASL